MTYRSADSLVLLTLGAVLAIAGAILVGTGNTEILGAIAILLAPTCALAFGLFGMNLFGRDGLAKKDTFVAMNVSLSLGLVVLTLSEIAGIAMGFIGSPEQLCFTVGLVQMPGLLLWGLGIISYLKSVNLSLDLIEGERLWPILVFVTIMGSLMIIAAVIVSNPATSPLSALVSAPTAIWLGTIFAMVTALVWVFRKGLLARPLIVLMIATAVAFTRGILWVVGDFCEGGALDDLMAIETYLLVGTSLFESAKLEMFLDE